MADLLHDAGSSAQHSVTTQGGEWEVGGGSRRRDGAYPRLVHADVQQKPTQHGKAIILQLKMN